MARWMTLCVLVAMCIGGPAPAMAAALPGPASASATAQDVNPGHDCADMPVTYSVNLPPEATTWVLRLRADAESAIPGYLTFDGASGDPLAGQGTMEICGDGEREERTLTWTVDWTFVDQGERWYTSDTGTAATFVVNGATPPGPFACPKCEDTANLSLRVVRKHDRAWVLKSVLVWRKGSDSARIADATILLAGPSRSGFKAVVERTNARGVATFRVKVPRRPVRLRTFFNSGKARWENTTIYLPKTRSASLRVG